MQSEKLITRVGGQPIDKESSALDILFKSLGIGPSQIPLEEDNGVVSIGSRLKALPAVNNDEMVTKSQTDQGQSDLQALIDQNAQDIQSLRQSLDDLAVLVGTNQADIASLWLAISKIYDSPPIEETFIATAGQTVFDATILQWNPDNTLTDILVFANGRKRTIDKTGALSEDYRKNSGTQIEFAYPLLEDTRVTVRHSVPFLTTQFFVNYQTGIQGFSIPVGEIYSKGSDRLSAFRNGLYMSKTASASIGSPYDRYAEETARIETEGASVNAEYWAFVHKSIAPSFRIPNSGLAGSPLTLPAYNVGTDRLLVFRGGLLMNTASLGSPVMQYAEAGPTSISLAAPSVTAENWIFEELGQAPIWREDFSGISGGTITFSNPYTIGSGKLLLFRNGVLVMNTSDTDFGGPAPSVARYQEATPTTVSVELASTPSTVWTAINLA